MSGVAERIKGVKERRRERVKDRGGEDTVRE